MQKGFHLCEYCQNPSSENTVFIPSSSGDITLVFETSQRERFWRMPDMIAHYVGDHSYQPPPPFIEDVMSDRFVKGSRVQTKGIGQSPADEKISVGYLSGNFPKGEIPQGFLERLEGLMRQAATDSGFPNLALRWSDYPSKPTSLF